jgi:hypothetical protein
MIDIDASLRNAGEQWRAGLDDDPSLEELFADATAARRRWHTPALVAASVAAVLALVLAVAAISTRDSTSSQSAGSGRCEDAFTPAPTQFIAGDPQWGGLKVDVRLTYTGSGPCVISRYGPDVDLLDRRGAIIARGGDSELIGLIPEQETVHRGDTVALSVRWSDFCAAPRTPITTLRVHLRSTQRTDAGGVDVPVEPTEPPRCELDQTMPGYPSTVVSSNLTFSSDSTGTRGAGSGVLSVGIRLSGGPPPLNVSPPPGNRSYLTPGKVTIADAAGIVATANLSGGHRTSIRVPAGRYVVRARFGDASCDDEQVSALPGRSTEVTVVCGVR